MGYVLLGVNLKSHFLMARSSTIPELRRRGGGVIVNTASVQGLQWMRGVPGLRRQQGGILTLTRQMAVEYAAEGASASWPSAPAWNPDPEMVRISARAEPDGEAAALVRYGQSHPIGRIGTADEIANVVLFLAGPASPS